MKGCSFGCGRSPRRQSPGNLEILTDLSSKIVLSQRRRAHLAPKSCSRLGAVLIFILAAPPLPRYQPGPHLEFVNSSMFCTHSILSLKRRAHFAEITFWLKRRAHFRFNKFDALASAPCPFYTEVVLSPKRRAHFHIGCCLHPLPGYTHKFDALA